MNTLCPRCGGDHTTPFSDSVFHSVGFECEDCKKDFGVIDETLTKKEKALISFSFEHKKQDGSSERVKIVKEGEKALLKLSEITTDKMLQPYEDIDFTESFDGFIKLLFEQLFLEDWPLSSQGFLTGKDESFKIEVRYELDCYPPLKIVGINKFPPYFKALDMILSTLFIQG